jgi:hypothetical protein
MHRICSFASNVRSHPVTKGAPPCLGPDPSRIPAVSQPRWDPPIEEDTRFAEGRLGHMYRYHRICTYLSKTDSQLRPLVRQSVVDRSLVTGRVDGPIMSSVLSVCLRLPDRRQQIPPRWWSARLRRAQARLHNEPGPSRIRDWPGGWRVRSRSASSRRDLRPVDAQAHHLRPTAAARSSYAARLASVPWVRTGSPTKPSRERHAPESAPPETSTWLRAQAHADTDRSLRWQLCRVRTHQSHTVVGSDADRTADAVPPIAMSE